MKNGHFAPRFHEAFSNSLKITMIRDVISNEQMEVRTLIHCTGVTKKGFSKKTEMKLQVVKKLRTSSKL